MTTKDWALQEKAPASFLEKFSSYPDFFIQILWGLGLGDRKDIEDFLSPSYDRDLHDPNLLKDIGKASDRIWQAIDKKEKIIIYGDFDADGVTSSVVLSSFFNELNFPVTVYMPDRQRDGHGLGMAAIESFIKEKVNLIVTLDCGTTNHKEVVYAQENGIDVVVTDHHQVIGSSPPVYAFVNPHQEGDKYPFKDLCGVGVAFKLFQVLAADSRAEGRWEGGKDKWLLDLVALGTVADMVPLLGENRALVKYGLFVLAQNRRVGIQELFKVAKIEPEFNRKTMQTNISAVTIGFSLAPRINSASRMKHAMLAYNLLIVDDSNRARELAQELEENNKKRRKDIDFILREAILRINKKNLPDFIVLSDDKWPVGVLGLIASRITDKFARPAMLIQANGDGAKASLRSVEGFDLMGALDSVSHLLEQYGGHRAAAGCSLKTENIGPLKEQLNKHARDNLAKDARVPKLNIASQIGSQEINLVNAELLEKLVPYGMANPQPKFLLRGLQLVDINTLGKTGQHAKLFFISGEDNIEGLMFFANSKLDNIQKEEVYDIVGELTVNVWNGMRSPQFKIIDIKKSE